MRKKIAVIADDLTGANDTGVQFAKQGLSTIVLLSARHAVESISEDVIVISTDSRSSLPEEAYQKVTEAAALFNSDTFKTIYKKVDSTLRGNLGIEIDAIMDTCGQTIAIVAPAFPENHRVTVGGYHLIQGVPLESTEISRDLKCPVTESHLPTLLAGQTRRKVGHIGIKTIMTGSRGICEKLHDYLATGHEVIACDVWHEEQFSEIVAAVSMLNRSVLWVGSAGLAAYFLPASDENISKPKAEPVLIMAGSLSNITHGQVARLRERACMTFIGVVPSALLNRETAEAEIQRCFNASVNAINAGNDVVIISGRCDENASTTTLDTLSNQQSAEIISAALGALCKQIATEVKLGGLVLTGGDIALSCCTSLAAKGIKIIREIAAGIPIGILKGGVCDSLPVVTKAGAFGSEDALCNAVDCLKNRLGGA